MCSFHHPPTNEVYTLSLHDALPISGGKRGTEGWHPCRRGRGRRRPAASISSRWRCSDRKSTRLNSSHLGISYAVFCVKKEIDEQKALHAFGGGMVKHVAK